MPPSFALRLSGAVPSVATTHVFTGNCSRKVQGSISLELWTTIPSGPKALQPNSVHSLYFPDGKEPQFLGVDMINIRTGSPGLMISDLKITVNK